MYRIIIFIGVLLSLANPSFSQEIGVKTIEINGKKINIIVAKRDTIYPYNIPLINLQGDTILSKEVLLKNDRPTVLVFWLTTCVPCRYELDAITKKYAQWKEEANFNFYAISLDFDNYQPDFYKRAKDYPFEAFIDYEKQFMDIMPGGLNGTPQTFIIDAEGKVTYHKRRYRIGDEDRLFEEIQILNLENKK